MYPDILPGHPGHQARNSTEMFLDTLPGSPGYQVQEEHTDVP